MRRPKYYSVDVRRTSDTTAAVEVVSSRDGQIRTTARVTPDGINYDDAIPSWAEEIVERHFAGTSLRP